MTPSPLVFDAQTATQAQKLAVGTLLADAFAYAYPDDPPRIPEKEALELTQLPPDTAVQYFAIWDGEKAVGFGSLDYSTTQNLHAAHANIVVDPAARRRGLGRQLARALETAAREQGRTTLTFGTTDKAPAGEVFARQLGAQPALPMRQSRLDLHALDTDLLREWQQRPEGDPYQLHVWETVPDAALERMADMMMVMNTAPKGELEQEDWLITPQMIRAWEKMTQESGETCVLMVMEDTRSGQFDGYSQVFWDKDRAALVQQGATAVRPSARGLGLGKTLKAAMLSHMLANFPGARWVRTNNASENAAMLGINVALGFEPYAAVTQWQLKLG